ncbi:MAG: 5,10-methylenetetrahydromethanopterin reductase [Nitrososphaerales archaeon]
MVNFGVEFVPKEVYWRTVYYAIQAEKGGFNNLWITDHFINRSVYVTLTLILNYTDKIKVGTGVTNPFLISPLATASNIASLNEVAPGRVVCGIGAGDLTTLQQAGVQVAKPLSTMKEAVQMMRALFSGEGLQNFEGSVFKVKSAKLAFKVRTPIPIYIGAQGAKMLKLAGEIGDGVLINASNPEDIREAVESVKEGASAAGRELDKIDIAAYTAFSIHENEEKAFKAALPVIAFIVAGSPDPILEKHNISLEAAKKIRDALVKGDFPAAFSSVTKEMADTFSIYGSPTQCIEKISQILKAGVTQFVVGSPIGGNVRKALDLVVKEVIPHFK